MAPALVEAVEQLIGEGVTLFFSQVFCKPPEVGGPKPVHQDNFYFAPSDTDALLTTWIALDAATEENGCLYYGLGSHHEPVLEHTAPEDAPFNLQVSGGCRQKISNDTSARTSRWSVHPSRQHTAPVIRQPQCSSAPGSDISFPA